MAEQRWWTTTREMEYIDGLGSHKEANGSEHKSRPRKGLLKLYLKGLTKRDIWHEDGLLLNKKKIEDRVLGELGWDENRFTLEYINKKRAKEGKKPVKRLRK